MPATIQVLDVDAIGKFEAVFRVCVAACGTIKDASALKQHNVSQKFGGYIEPMRSIVVHGMLGATNPQTLQKDPDLGTAKTALGGLESLKALSPELADGPPGLLRQFIDQANSKLADLGAYALKTKAVPLLTAVATLEPMKR